jgi:hypothetical protein
MTQEENTKSKANDKQVAGTHYRTKGIQPWDYIAENNIGYFEGNIIKYVSRWKDKGGVQDLEKARHYLDKLIELNENKQLETEPPILEAVTGKRYQEVDLTKWT